MSATAVRPPATDEAYQERKNVLPSPAERAARQSLDATNKGPVPQPARRISLILHGKRADQPDVRAAVKKMREEGVELDVKVTWEAGDVSKFVEDIVKARSADTIVAAGGDGTLNEVVAALIKTKAPRDIAVGLLPMGTSNDFAAVTNLPNDLESALRLCCRSDNLKALDVGLLNGEVFMNTATLGASSELGNETSHEAKQLLGPAAYLVTGVQRLIEYEALPIRLRFPAPTSSSPTMGSVTSLSSIDNFSSLQSLDLGVDAKKLGAALQSVHDGDSQRLDQDLKGPKGPRVVEMVEPVLNLTAGNSRQLASMVQACPDALLDDGLLDITYVAGNPSENATKLVGEILTHGLDEAKPTNVRMMRVPWLEVTVVAEDKDVEWPGNRDGEPVPNSRKFLLEALPRRVLMHLPEDSSEILTEGADPKHNAPVITLNRAHRGAFKRMFEQVTRFRRMIPNQRPKWQQSLLASFALFLALIVSAMMGYRIGQKDLKHYYERVDA